MVTWVLHHKLFVAIAAIVAYFLFAKKVKAAARVSEEWEFDANVFSPTFGEPIR